MAPIDKVLIVEDDLEWQKRMRNKTLLVYENSGKQCEIEVVGDLKSAMTYVKEASIIVLDGEFPPSSGERKTYLWRYVIPEIKGRTGLILYPASSDLDTNQYMEASVFGEEGIRVITPNGKRNFSEKFTQGLSEFI